MNPIMNDTALINLAIQQINQQVHAQLQQNNPWTPVILLGIIWFVNTKWKEYKEAKSQPIEKMHKDITREAIVNIEKRQLEIKGKIDTIYSKNEKVLEKIDESLCELKYVIKGIKE